MERCRICQYLIIPLNLPLKLLMDAAIGSGQPKQIKNQNTETETIRVWKTEFWPKPNYPTETVISAEMTLFLPKWWCFGRIMTVSAGISNFCSSVQVKMSLPKEHISAGKGCFGRIMAVLAGISHFGWTTENNFYRIKCFCRIIGRIIDRLFGRYDIRLPTI